MLLLRGHLGIGNSRESRPIPPVPPVPKVKFHQIKKIKLVAHYLMNFNKGEDESLFIMPAFDSDTAQELLKIAF